MIPRKVFVAQKGAREHFLAARAAHRQGLLAGLITDWYAPQSGTARGLLRFFGKQKAASALAAECTGVPYGMVRSFPFRSMLWRWCVRQGAAQGRLYEAYTHTDAAFAEAVARLQLPQHEIYFGYSYASLEALVAEKSRGILTVLDQIDPGAVEFRMVAEEMARFPELAGPPLEFPAAYYERNRREWDLADVIVVNSEWTREAIIADGADPAKIEVLPLAYEEEVGRQRSEVGGQRSEVRDRPLKVLWLGQVNVRKGIHYLLEAARLLEQKAVEFLVAGPLMIRKDAMFSAPKNVRWLGQIPRSEASALYNQCDVFVLPTLSDGFAITQLEALAHGLPAIVTPNCGRVVVHGKTGFVVPPCDAEALTVAILQFVRNRKLSSEMSLNCRQAAAEFSIDAYGQRLIEIINEKMKARVRVC